MSQLATLVITYNRLTVTFTVDYTAEYLDCSCSSNEPKVQTLIAFQPVNLSSRLR